MFFAFQQYPIIMFHIQMPHEENKKKTKTEIRILAIGLLVIKLA